MTGTGADGGNVRGLRDRPFELLRAIEKRSRNSMNPADREPAPGTEWVGVAFRMGGETFLVAREETREVLGFPTAITRVPGARSWVKGLANVRGQLLPMVDLRQFLGSGLTTMSRNARVVVVNHRDIPAGLMVDEVLGFRRFAEREFDAEPPPTVIRCDSFLAGAFRRGTEVWPVLSLRSLVESQQFMQAAH
ncbi:MAG: purine-binding chemotaxis protein CheW [Proteobacteria bacterium]|nr:purine-binding chemotaxis protein CheW [Pseudomonadota bacterium]